MNLVLLERPSVLTAPSQSFHNRLLREQSLLDPYKLREQLDIDEILDEVSSPLRTGPDVPLYPASQRELSPLSFACSVGGNPRCTGRVWSLPRLGSRYAMHELCAQIVRLSATYFAAAPFFRSCARPVCPLIPWPCVPSTPLLGVSALPLLCFSSASLLFLVPVNWSRYFKRARNGDGCFSFGCRSSSYSPHQVFPHRGHTECSTYLPLETPHALASLIQLRNHLIPDLLRRARVFSRL